MKTTRRQRQRENGIIFPYMDVGTPFSYWRRIVFAKSLGERGESYRTRYGTLRAKWKYFGGGQKFREGGGGGGMKFQGSFFIQ